MVRLLKSISFFLLAFLCATFGAKGLILIVPWRELEICFVAVFSVFFALVLWIVGKSKLHVRRTLFLGLALAALLNDLVFLSDTIS